MHLSTHNWMRAEPLETTLSRIKKFGYQSIEISASQAVRAQGNPPPSQGIRHSLLGIVTLTLGDRNLAARMKASAPARSIM